MTKNECGTVRGSIISNNGDYDGDIYITDVNVTPEAKYNLLSITSLLRSGWKLQGNDDELSLTRGQPKIVFDIKN